MEEAVRFRPCVLHQHWLNGFTAQSWHFDWPRDHLWDRVLAPVRMDQWRSGQAPSECWCIHRPHLASCGTFDSMWLCLLSTKAFFLWVALGWITLTLTTVIWHSFVQIRVPHYDVYLFYANRRKYWTFKLLCSMIIKQHLHNLNIIAWFQMNICWLDNFILSTQNPWELLHCN